MTYQEQMQERINKAVQLAKVFITPRDRVDVAKATDDCEYTVTAFLAREDMEDILDDDMQSVESRQIIKLAAMMNGLVAEFAEDVGVTLKLAPASVLEQLMLHPEVTGVHTRIIERDVVTPDYWNRALEQSVCFDADADTQSRKNANGVLYCIDVERSLSDCSTATTRTFGVTVDEAAIMAHAKLYDRPPESKYVGDCDE